MRAEHTILLPQQKAIYFSIPKNACTSLKTFCCDLLRISIRESWQAHIQDYSHYRDTLIDRIRYRNHFKFAFVRNPWDRLVSCYKSKIDNPPDAQDYWLRDGLPECFAGFGFKPQMPFSEFVAIVCALKDEDADPHFASQSSLLYRDSRLLCNFVGRVEVIQTDFKKVAERLGRPDATLPCENRADNRRHYRDFYTDKLRRDVESRFAADIENFGYSF